jgi:hypothetical protein
VGKKIFPNTSAAAVPRTKKSWWLTPVPWKLEMAALRGVAAGSRCVVANNGLSKDGESHRPGTQRPWNLAIISLRRGGQDPVVVLAVASPRWPRQSRAKVGFDCQSDHRSCAEVWSNKRSMGGWRRQ